MRYYELTLTPPGSSTPIRKWTSYPNGKPDPCALNIMFDAIVSNAAAPSGNQTITVEGISLADLSEALQWGIHPDSTGKLIPGMNLTLKAGMGGGLPLENKGQQGTIVKGQVVQAFGNWIGTEMTLDFVIAPGVFTEDTPGNFVLNWTKGQKLSDALKSMLSVAYKGYDMPIAINISENWVADQDMPGFSGTLEGIATQILGSTMDQSDGPVVIGVQNGKILVQDSTYKPDAIQINFNDLIGQPTWVEPNTMQIGTVMRADLQLGSHIEMPKGFVGAPGSVTTTAQSQPSQLKYKSTFTQSYFIKSLRHVGNFRSTDSGEWATIFKCSALGPLG